MNKISNTIKYSIYGISFLIFLVLYFGYGFKGHIFISKFLEKKTEYYFAFSTNSIDYLIIALIPLIGMVFNSSRKKSKIFELIMDISTIILFVTLIVGLGFYILTFIGKPTNPFYPQFFIIEPFKFYITLFIILGVSLPFIIRYIINKVIKKQNKDFDFGIFSKFWDGNPNYLPLLNLTNIENKPTEWNLIKSLKKIDKIISKNNEQDIIEGIKKLLNNEYGWRPHLVACISVLKISKKSQIVLIPEFWNLITNKGSWVSPQVLVILSIIDENFSSKAKEISKSSSISMKSSIEYLLNGKFEKEHSSNNGGIHAKNWKTELLKLTNEGLI